MLNKLYVAVLLVLLSPLAQSVTDCSAVTEIPQEECEALVALYDSTDGDGAHGYGWAVSTNWKRTNQPCGWFGIVCGGEHVIKVSFSANNLRGQIPSELGNLSRLQVLKLRNDRLTGSIPSELGDLSQLQILDLFDSQVTGSIPSELGDLSRLQILNLSQNQLTGSIHLSWAI